RRTSDTLRTRRTPAAHPASAVLKRGLTAPATLIEPSTQVVYPEAAKQAGESGEVGLVLRVADDGRVIVVDIEKSSGFGSLDDAARMAVFRWRFRPSMRDGLATSAYPRVTVSYSISPNKSARTSARLAGG
ncbi:MAG: hypothetical protein DI532_22825, partial [Azospirillum brasilense]